MPGAGGRPADLLQILRIAQQPVVSFRLRRPSCRSGKAVLLMPEREEMGEPLGRFGATCRQGALQPADIALDERGSDLGDRVPVLEQPPRELIAASQIMSDAVPRIPLLAQGTGKRIEVRTQGPAAQPGQLSMSEKNRSRS